MSYYPSPFGHVPQSSFHAGAFDAFGRQRVSQIQTLFDSKMLNDNLPLFWDDQEVSGSGTTSVYNQNRAGVTLGVAAATAGHRRRQTRQHFNYQPGKSQMILMTGVPVLTGGGTGITVQMGLFDGDNGICFCIADGVPGFRIRSNVTGSPVDTTTTQPNWNVDTLDGNGPSGITLDPTKAQIVYFDFEWLGVGSVRMGFVIDGQYVIVHKQHNANVINSVYMSSPNLPLIYEIINDGTGAATTMEQICSTVMSEGGTSQRASTRGVTTGGIGITPANLAVAAAIGIRLKASAHNQSLDLSDISIVNEGNTPGFEWHLYFNPTVAGTFTYSDLANSHVQLAIGNAAGTNTITGGTLLATGVGTGAKTGGLAQAALDTEIKPGSSIDGTSDEFVLAVVPYGAQAEIDVALNWRERT